MDEGRRVQSFAWTNGALRTAKACGPGTPGLVLSLRDVSQATVTNKVMDTGEQLYWCRSAIGLLLSSMHSDEGPTSGGGQSWC
jgi:hypothetical protein